MKSEHRHELKSNELADWLTHLPQWTKENLGTIITVVAAIVVVGGFYGWKAISKNVKSSEHAEFTSIMDDIITKKVQVVGQQGTDMSYVLLNKATELEKFAGTTNDKNIAALSLVKAADCVRTELQYRTEIVSQKDLVEKVNKAKKNYTDAIAKKPSDKTIKGLAEFGLGLCAEELGDFEEARKIYSSIVENPDLAGTINISKAQLRLNIMDDYKQDIVFQPAPEEPIPSTNEVLDPIIQQLRNANNKVGDSNSPLIIDALDMNSSDLEIDSVLPIETNLPSEIDIPDDINNLEQ
ncbi:MAG: hypothetical protein JXA96_16945 [Sedimentisphaerales bacterium]|nr:hypothetical protein [Sedimentisphaerales bacterium]